MRGMWHLHRFHISLLTGGQVAALVERIYRLLPEIVALTKKFADPDCGEGSRVPGRTDMRRACRHSGGHQSS